MKVIDGSRGPLLVIRVSSGVIWLSLLRSPKGTLALGSVEGSPEGSQRRLLRVFVVSSHANNKHRTQFLRLCLFCPAPPFSEFDKWQQRRKLELKIIVDLITHGDSQHSGIS